MSVSTQKVNLPNKQYQSVLKGLKHEVVTYPPATAPNWGVQTSYFIRNGGGILLHDVYLHFNLSAISGLTGSVTNYPANNPSFFFVKTIEIYVNGVLAQLFPAPALSQYLSAHLFQTDEMRAVIEGAGGSHTAIAQRNAKSIITDNWILPLRSFWSESSFSVLNNTQELEIKVTFDSPSNFVAQSTLTGTPAITLNSCNLVAFISKIPNQIVSQELALISKIPKHQRFHREIYFQTALLSGSTSTTITLSQLTGLIDYIVFVVRPQNALTNTGAYTFTPITNFHYLDSTGSSMCGGNPITHIQSLGITARRNTKSSFLAEGLLSTWNSYAYVWSSNANLLQSVEHGLNLSPFKFTGNEQLILQYPTLGSASVVDIFAYRMEIIEQKPNGVSVYPASEVQ